jgi:BlaI family transcriptional regulator, penicillinase repressor
MRHGMPATKPVSISEAESVVMEVIWRTNPIATEDVIAALAHKEEWQEPTVKTLLNRLFKKGAISARKNGRRYLYSPALKREQWLAVESKGFLDRLFDGRVAPLVSHFSQHKKLSKKDIADLRRLIKELDDGG